MHKEISLLRQWMMIVNFNQQNQTRTIWNCNLIRQFKSSFSCYILIPQQSQVPFVTKDFFWLMCTWFSSTWLRMALNSHACAYFLVIHAQLDIAFFSSNARLETRLGWEKKLKYDLQNITLTRSACLFFWTKIDKAEKKLTNWQGWRIPKNQ